MLSHFYCPQCKIRIPDTGILQRCSVCGSVLVARYDYITIKNRLDPEGLCSRAKSIWRYLELLPLHDEANIVTLGESVAPVIALGNLSKIIGLSHLFIKNDSCMPFSSGRSRLAAITLSKAKEEGVAAVIARCDAREAFIIGAYAARAGVNAVLVVRKNLLSATDEQNILSTGATLFSYENSQSEIEALVERSATAHGWFNITPFYEPYRLEGAKSFGLELAEDFCWEVPDVIVLPVFEGAVLAGVYRAMRDLIALGWIKKRLPRLVAVQMDDYAPLVEAWRAKKLHIPSKEKADAIAFGTCVEFRNQAEYLSLDAVYKSLGAAVSVPLEAAKEKQQMLLRHEGVIVSLSGAATLEAACQLKEEGWIKRSDRVLLYNAEADILPAFTLKNSAKAMPVPAESDAVLPGLYPNPPE